MNKKYMIEVELKNEVKKRKKKKLTWYWKYVKK